MRLPRTPEQIAEEKELRERFEREQPSLEDLVTSGEYNDPLPMGEHLSIRQAVFALRKAREAAGLSLADMAERTGIDKAQLSRIETGQHSNPTVSTLCRYAHGLGKQWKWTLEDEAPGGRQAPAAKISEPPPQSAATATRDVEADPTILKFRTSTARSTTAEKVIDLTGGAGQSAYTAITN